MLELVTLPAAFGMRNPSPFCLKAEMLLTALELPFKTSTIPDPRKAPKGKQPWAVCDGITVPDSTFLRLHLEEQYGIDFYPGLSPSEKAVAWAFEKMCEDHLYWCAVHDRWMIDANFDKGPRNFFGIVPPLMRPLVIGMVRRAIKRDLHGQGIGRHRVR